ncbi:MAG: Mpo1-like protein [Betaproteobacteria bacterium]
MAESAYRSFESFYPFYLSQHGNRTCRRLHFAGTWPGLLALLLAFSTLNFWWLLAGLAGGYALAWVGHFFFEKNRPATFTYPLYSFIGDWVMWKDMLTGRIRF